MFILCSCFYSSTWNNTLFNTVNQWQDTLRACKKKSTTKQENQTQEEGGNNSCFIQQLKCFPHWDYHMIIKNSKLHSPKSVLTGMVFLETSSANSWREYSVFGLRLRKVCCHWSGNTDRAEEERTCLQINCKKQLFKMHSAKIPNQQMNLKLHNSSGKIHNVFITLN